MGGSKKICYPGKGRHTKKLLKLAPVSVTVKTCKLTDTDRRDENHLKSLLDVIRGVGGKV